jgi:GNAT superfamily N-acetyltransferase
MLTNDQINVVDPEQVKAVYLAAEDIKIAASILYLAYHDDPLFLDIFEHEKEGYESRLRSAIREELNAFWTDKQPMIGLFDDERLIAVACVINPSSAIGGNRFWHWRLKMLLTAGYFGTKQMLHKESIVREHVPAERFHMLSLIAVHPDHQAHGLGHILMRAIDSVVLEDESSEGIGMYVTLPKFRAFFEENNFTFINNIEVGHIQGQLMFKRR